MTVDSFFLTVKAIIVIIAIIVTTLAAIVAIRNIIRVIRDKLLEWTDNYRINNPKGDL